MDRWVDGLPFPRLQTAAWSVADFSNLPFVLIPLGQCLKDNLQQIIYGLIQVPIDLSSRLNLWKKTLNSWSSWGPVLPWSLKPSFFINFSLEHTHSNFLLKYLFSCTIKIYSLYGHVYMLYVCVCVCVHMKYISHRSSRNSVSLRRIRLWESKHSWQTWLFSAL